MKDQLERNIKELMAEHPGLGTILEAAGIGCASCGLGTCRTRDILEIHDLDPEASHRLLAAMGTVIHAGRPFEVPQVERKARPTAGGFCPPIARMMQEHACILRFIRLLPKLSAALERDFEAARPWLAGGLDFIRTYADRYHHAKEEEILFGFFEEGAPVLQAMRADHAQGRAHGAGLAQALDQASPEQALRHLEAYGELLQGHIHREDTLLYPWMERTLSTRQVGELFARCAAVDAAWAPEVRRKEAFVPELETWLTSRG